MRKMPDDVIITDTLTIPAAEIGISAIRAQGAGGQNVNKVASAVHLRFDVAGSPSLPDAVRERLLAAKDSRISSDGILVIKSQRHRTQERNRRAAVERLRKVIADACVEQAPRKKTRPGKAARERRLAQKRQRSKIKQARGRPRGED